MDTKIKYFIKVTTITFYLSLSIAIMYISVLFTKIVYSKATNSSINVVGEYERESFLFKIDYNSNNISITTENSIIFDKKGLESISSYAVQNKVNSEKILQVDSFKDLLYFLIEEKKETFCFSINKNTKLLEGYYWNDVNIPTYVYELEVIPDIEVDNFTLKNLIKKIISSLKKKEVLSSTSRLDQKSKIKNIKDLKKISKNTNNIKNKILESDEYKSFILYFKNGYFNNIVFIFYPNLTIGFSNGNRFLKFENDNYLLLKAISENLFNEKKIDIDDFYDDKHLYMLYYDSSNTIMKISLDKILHSNNIIFDKTAFYNFKLNVFEFPNIKLLRKMMRAFVKEETNEDRDSYKIIIPEIKNLDNYLVEKMLSSKDLIIYF